MDVTQIPFNHFLGIQQAAQDSGCLLELGDSPSYTNHLGTVHASVQLALAEASSGEFLLRTLPEFGNQVLAVVRRRGQVQEPDTRQDPFPSRHFRD